MRGQKNVKAKAVEKSSSSEGLLSGVTGCCFAQAVHRVAARRARVGTCSRVQELEPKSAEMRVPGYDGAA